MFLSINDLLLSGKRHRFDEIFVDVSEYRNRLIFDAVDVGHWMGRGVICVIKHCRAANVTGVVSVYKVMRRGDEGVNAELHGDLAMAMGTLVLELLCIMDRILRGASQVPGRGWDT